MPVDMKKYPKGWSQFSDTIRFKRAESRCECPGGPENCGLHHEHRCNEHHMMPAKWSKGLVVLTVAHLCSCSPLCMIPEHVQAQCQRCHLRRDVPQHTQSRIKNRRLKLEANGQMRIEEA